MVADSVERQMDRKFGFAGGEGFNAALPAWPLFRARVFAVLPRLSLHHIL